MSIPIFNIIHIAGSALGSHSPDITADSIIFVYGEDPPAQYERKTLQEELHAGAANAEVIIILSRQDDFSGAELSEALSILPLNANPHELLLLTRHKNPPVFQQRMDGIVRSCIFTTDLVTDGLTITPGITENIIFDIVCKSLDNENPCSVNVHQFGKDAVQKNEAHNNHLTDSMLIVPHIGNTGLLHRCLNSLSRCHATPASVNVCFDDDSSSGFDASAYTLPLALYANLPQDSGPYPARHYSIVQSHTSYIFFNDSDDVSTSNRFTKLMAALQERELDMIGSHEIRIDEFQRNIKLYRYPLDVNNALRNGSPHAHFHPTSLIRRSAYLKTGGFSTDLTFGYDTQFLLRASLFIRIGNADDFLYIRYKRPGSLTTNEKTKLGSRRREFLAWRWFTDYRLILQQRISLQSSSLRVRNLASAFRLVPIS